MDIGFLEFYNDLYLCFSENESLLKQISNHSVCTLFMEGWIQGWKSLQDVFHITLSSAHIWKHGSRALEKRRAFTDLLAVLEGCGLSRNISRISEVSFVWLWFFFFSLGLSCVCKNRESQSWPVFFIIVFCLV